MCDKVAGSSPKGAMVKEGCFLPLKNEKPPEIKDYVFYLKNEDLRSKLDKQIANDLRDFELSSK